MGGRRDEKNNVKMEFRPKRQKHCSIEFERAFLNDELCSLNSFMRQLEADSLAVLIALEKVAFYRFSIIIHFD